MNDDLFSRARDVFLSACDRESDARARFLDDACGDDAALRAEVEELLQFHDLNRGGGERSFLRPPAAAGVPDVIGDYHLLRKLGEGGMGVVYEAEQRQPIQRRVAIKLIKGRLPTQEVLDRFGVERQALALMNHPNIARVFDAGATEEGLPFFVMEFVAGVPINGYCDSHQLTLRERLELILQVCQGAHHAHQKGIIHRDLKPSNVLVAEEDGTAVPKIIDFGVAKATGPRLTERTVFTEFGQWIGTPEYMSPEQAELTSLDLDIRTDVYSLGVVLYELLVGVPPLDSKALRQSSFDEMRRRIREEEPPRPSARVGLLGTDSEAAAARRKTDTTRWAMNLRGDLDSIVLKALEKDRGRRYGSATELAADLARHLRDEPVLARPASGLYRMTKFVRRHRAGVVAAALAAATLVTGLAFATVGLIRAQRAERLANTQVELLVAMIEGMDPNIGASGGARPEEMLGALAKRIDADLASQPLVRSRLQLSIARIYSNLEADGRAQALYEDALRVQRQFGLPETEPGVVAYTLRNLGDLQGRIGDYAASRRHLEEALAIAERHLGPEHETTVASLADLAMVLWRTGEYGDALELAGRVVERREKNRIANDQLVAYALFIQGISWHGLGELHSAREALERSLQIRERGLGPDASSVAWVLNRLGLVLLAQGDVEQASVLLERALSMQLARFGPESYALIEPLSGLGGVRLSLGDVSGAESLYERALNLQQRRYGDDHHFLAWSLDNLGRVAEVSGNADEARALYERALVLREKAFGLEHLFVTMSLDRLGRLALDQGDDARALSLLERRLKILEAVRTTFPFAVAQARIDVARVRLRTGDHLEARRLFEFVRMDANRHVVPAGISSAEYYLDASCLAARIGEAEEALTWLREAVDRGLPPSRLAERPELNVLRARPEFHDLVARAKPPPR